MQDASSYFVSLPICALSVQSIDVGLEIKTRAVTGHDLVQIVRSSILSCPFVINRADG